MGEWTRGLSIQIMSSGLDPNLSFGQAKLLNQSHLMLKAPRISKVVPLSAFNLNSRKREENALLRPDLKVDENTRLVNQAS